MGQFEHSNDIPVDLTKELAEWALVAGRSFQSHQTGYVHLCYGDDEPKAQTIPLYENFLFVLALFRSRLVDNVQEGKKNLKCLLAFQQERSGEDPGNFPVYLHEYPFCQDPAQGIYLLAPMYWILKQFGHILGSDLKAELEKAALLNLEYRLRANKNKSFPYFLQLRLIAAEVAFGSYWKKDDMIRSGNELLRQLEGEQLEGWQTTKHLADILVALQMIYPKLSQTPWSPLWERMDNTWHSKLGCYVGPCIREWQEKEEPQVNLYDLFCGYFSGQFSKRAKHLSAQHLHGILIQPSSDRFNKESTIQEKLWRTVNHLGYTDTFLEKTGPLNPRIDKTFTPYRCIWGDLERLHSFVCQGGDADQIHYREEGNSVVLQFDLKNPSSDEEISQKREIEFFVDFQPDSQFHCKGQSTTTFQLEETMEITFPGHRLSCTFQLIEGEGDFVVHVMRGNRPSQIANKGEKRFQSYDWTFFLRTIRRKGCCKVQVTLIHE